MSGQCFYLFLVVAFFACGSDSQDTLVTTIIKALLPKSFKFSEDWKNRLIGEKNFSLDVTLNGRRKREAPNIRIELFQEESRNVEKNVGKVIQDSKKSDNSPWEKGGTLFTLGTRMSTTTMQTTTSKMRTTFNWQKWMRGMFTRRTKSPKTTSNSTTEMVAVHTEGRTSAMSSWYDNTITPFRENETKQYEISTAMSNSLKDSETSVELTSLSPSLDNLTTTVGRVPPVSVTSTWSLISETSPSSETNPTVKTTRKPWFMRLTKKVTATPNNVTTAKMKNRTGKTAIGKQTGSNPTKPSSTMKMVSTKNSRFIPATSTLATVTIPSSVTTIMPRLSSTTRKSPGTVVRPDAYVTILFLIAIKFFH